MPLDQIVGFLLAHRYLQHLNELVLCRSGQVVGLLVGEHLVERVAKAGKFVAAARAQRPGATPVGDLGREGGVVADPPYDVARQPHADGDGGRQGADQDPHDQEPAGAVGRVGEVTGVLCILQLAVGELVDRRLHRGEHLGGLRHQ